MFKRIHIVGRKNSGKTTLIVDLVQYLTSSGMRVGTIKHTHHRHELDTPGKDSHRHRAAGASAVGILSPGISAVFRPTDATDDELRYRELDHAFADCDLVLVEGHLMTPGPKVEVWRAATGTAPVALDHHDVRCVVSDDVVERIVQPVLPRSDLPRVAARIVELANEVASELR